MFPKAKQASRLPLHIDYVGDEAAGLQYRLRAITKLLELRRQGGNVPRHAVLDIDDAHIEIQANTLNSRIRITITTGVYLDSGFYNHKTFAYMNASAFLPSALLYGAQQTGGLVQGDLIVKAGKAEGKAILTARDSKPMGKKKPLVKSAPNGITNPYAIYADDATLLKRKKIQSLCRPSCYCGLTALYVQCLYGSMSGQTQYDMPAMDDTGAILLFNAPSISIKAGLYTTGFLKGQQRWVNLPFDGATAPWVCVTRFWRYWLVTVNGVKVTFRRIKANVPNPFSTVSYSGLEARQMHSTFLAGAKLSSTVLTFTCAAVLGTPLAYGWKTDDTGQQARIVTHTNDTTTHTGRYYAAAVLFDVEGTPTGLNIQLLEAKPWDLTAGSHALWTPDWFSNKQVASAPLGPYAGWGNVACDAPLYVRVVLTGTETAWDVWRVKGSAGIAEPVGFSGSGGSAMGITPSVPFTGVIETMVYGGEASFGYVSFGLRDLEGSGRPMLVNTVIHDNGGAYYSGYFPSIMTGMYYHPAVYDNAAYTNLVDAKSAALLIPFYDCNAIAHGTRDFRGFDSLYARHSEGRSRITRATYNYRDLTPPRNNDPVQAYEQFDNGVQTWAIDGFADGVDTYTSLGTTTSNTPGNLTLLVGNAALPTTAPHLAYFEPDIGPLGDPYISPSNVLTALGGSYNYALTFGESGKADWPDGTQIPVGWA